MSQTKSDKVASWEYVDGVWITPTVIDAIHVKHGALSIPLCDLLRTKLHNRETLFDIKVRDTFSEFDARREAADKKFKRGIMKCISQNSTMCLNLDSQNSTLAVVWESRKNANLSWLVKNIASLLMDDGFHAHVVGFYRKEERALKYLFTQIEEMMVSVPTDEPAVKDYYEQMKNDMKAKLDASLAQAKDYEAMVLALHQKKSRASRDASPRRK